MPRRRIPLSQIADIFGGYAFKGEDFADIGFPVVKIASIEPPIVNLEECERIPLEKVAGLDRFRLQDRDIVMAMTGATIGKVGRIRSQEAAYLNQRVAKISAKAGHEFDDFIFALLSQAGFDQEVLNNSAGSAQANVSTDDIGRILIPEFSPEEQLQIGHMLGTFDDKIELNRRMNETLEAIARAIFQSWFVDFDPVRAKASGDPTDSICRRLGLTPDLLALFPDSFQESELGEIPISWRATRIDNAVEVASGKRPENRQDKPSPDFSIPLYGGAGPMGYVATSLVTNPVLVTGRVGTLGIVHRVTNPIWPSDNTLVLHPKVSNAFEFLYLALLKIDLAGLNRGSTQPLLTQRDLGQQLLILPSNALLEQFAELVSPMFSRIDGKVRENDVLSALRDTLLPKLLSGELRVPEADKMIEAMVR